MKQAPESDENQARDSKDDRNQILEKLEAMEPAQRESALILSLALDYTRQDYWQRSSNFLTGGWLKGGSREALQQRFIAAIHYQQVVQRLGSGILTQKPSLEWVTRGEAEVLMGCHSNVFNRYRDQDVLEVIQRQHRGRVLVRLNFALIRRALEFSHYSRSENLTRIRRFLNSRRFKPSSKRYRDWRLSDPVNLKAVQAITVNKKMRRAVRESEMMRQIPGQEAHFYRQYNDQESGNILSDIEFFHMHEQKIRAAHWEPPPLLYFTTEEAAYYLRVSTKTIHEAVKAEKLNTRHTVGCGNYMFEKHDLLSYASGWDEQTVRKRYDSILSFKSCRQNPTELQGSFIQDSLSALEKAAKHSPYVREKLDQLLEKLKKE